MESLGHIRNKKVKNWIVITEETSFPKVWTTVLVATKKGFVGTGCICKKNPNILWEIDQANEIEEDDIVIAFQYLPDHPKLIKDENGDNDAFLESFDKECDNRYAKT